MLRFTGEPERPADMLSKGLTEIVWLWLYLSLFFLPEGALDEAMGCHPILHSQGPRHAEMVESTRMTGGWMETPLF